MREILILAVGNDPVLLQTRKQILQNAGYIVLSVSTSEAITQLRQRDFGIVILCHSIPADDRARLTGFIREHRPGSRVIFISSNFGVRDPLADATIESDPEHLVASMRAVCRSSSYVPIQNTLIPRSG